MFGGVNAAQQLRLIFAELGASSIPSSFVVPKVHKVFDQNANLLDDTYDKRIIKFLEEFEWYIEALKNQRAKGTPYQETKNDRNTIEICQFTRQIDGPYKLENVRRLTNLTNISEG